MRKFLIMGCVVVLSACTLPYKAPDADKIAKIRFYVPEASGSFQSVGIYAFKDDRCGGASKLRQLGGIQLGGISSRGIDIGMWKDSETNYEKNVYVEIPVVAEERFNFAIVGSYAGATCNLTLSFLPRTNQQYEVNYFTVGRQCNAAINEIALEGGRITKTREPSSQMNQKACTFFWN